MFCVSSLCISATIPHTPGTTLTALLPELYQEKLVTKDEMKRMKGEVGYLSDRVVHVQCSKPPEVVGRTVNVLDKYGHNQEAARLLRGW